MAKVFGQRAGGTAQEVEATTVGDVRTSLGIAENFSASINGVQANDSQPVSDYQVVTFAPQVKGA